MSDETKELREALEKAQGENKALRMRVAELKTFDPEELLARIAALEADCGELRARLEQADKVRATWDARTQQLRRELEIAHAEQERLRSVLENERLARGGR